MMHMRASDRSQNHMNGEGTFSAVPRYISGRRQMMPTDMGLVVYIDPNSWIVRERNTGTCRA
jgi:hypothetical protein